MKKNILVLVDFQNDFVAPQGVLTIDNPNLIERVQTFNNNLQKGMFEEIIITADNHFHETYDLTPEADNFPPHCIHGSWGWKLAVEFKKNIPVNILYKSSTNIWNEAPNYKMLQKDWSDCNVYIAGVLSDVCVKQAMEGFLDRGVNVIIFDDLTQGLHKQIPEIINESKYVKAVEKGIKAYQLLKPVVINGEVVARDIDYCLQEIQKTAMSNLDKLDGAYKRLTNPHAYGVGLERDLKVVQKQMIVSHQKQERQAI